MSLKAKLIAMILIALATILIVGGMLSHLHAQRRIAVELGAARMVAMNAITRLIAELPASTHPARDLESLVRTFNGDRHVRLLLIDAHGRVTLQSSLAPPEFMVPAAFEQLLGPGSKTQMIPLPPNAAPVVAAMLAVVPVNEIAEVWADIGLNLILLGLFVALAFALLLGVVGQALRPLGQVVSGFHRIGKGDYGVRLEPRGTPEFAGLARGFNEMATQLEAMARKNQRLSEQLLRLQDEERAELARDLHDDVGPFLFAIDVDAAGIEERARQNPGDAEIVERTAAIRQAARHARLQVRRILGTLRPGLLPGLGLPATLEHLVSQCRRRHPSIAFRLDIGEDEAFGAQIDALLHRVVREAVNNALRHGTPEHISIKIGSARDGVNFRISDDGGGWPEGRPAIGRGYGLTGMRERVEAMGGHLDIAEIPVPPGLCISGHLPFDCEGEAAFAHDGNGREGAVA